jgi:hypothetical protein
VDPHATLSAFPQKRKQLSGTSIKQGATDPAERRELQVEELMRRQRKHDARQRREQRKLLEEDTTAPFPGQQKLRPEELHALEKLIEVKAGAREQRLRVAEKRRQMNGTQTQASPLPAAGATAGSLPAAGLTGMQASTSAWAAKASSAAPPGLGGSTQRVVHRHVHHHVHYHEAQPETDGLPALPGAFDQGGFPQPHKAGWVVSGGPLPKTASMGDLRAVPAQPGFLKHQVPMMGVSASAGQLLPMDGISAEDAETPRKQPFGGPPRALVPSPLWTAEAGQPQPVVA